MKKKLEAYMWLSDFDESKIEDYCTYAVALGTSEDQALGLVRNILAVQGAEDYIKELKHNK